MNTSHDTTNSLPRQLVPVKLAERSYEIAIVHEQWNLLPSFMNSWLERIDHLKSAARKALLVTDTNVVNLFAGKLRQELIEQNWTVELTAVPAGESSKSLAMANQIYDQLVEMQADRQTVVIAVGGGVVGDLAGFVAATYNRGLPFVQVPTTLLADVDSSVGGKVGINHAKGKNLIGAFHQPLGVFIDTSSFNTLPDRDYRSGLAEVVKYGVILDANLFETLENNIEAINSRDPEILIELVKRSCQLKADVVEQDEYERSGLRAILNYGHTFAHAYEALCGYGELMHGEAVSIGMIDASRLAEKLGMIGEDVTERQIQLLSKLGLPTDLPQPVNFTHDDIISRMKIDKKTVAGQLRFVLPRKLGQVEVVKGIDEQLVREVLSR
ncbi:3-dehydroquinate synthase [Rubinisphaera sp.]|uniref:3-dehydroquinate synthase n=1 Tax=Rubinisphaera sp. TaxID=2024857 RepID=UPI000C114A57|nr:3-dehydroquinate synthase [Rubinisphaera sp.]MBV07763.1 3-dehydroquinate synthase [Rubinisphaera sp.]HCS52067.1 3-dehydroquinate synthase [Planctomycetaceae bacterium]